jgi:hypothetical protein
MIRDMITHKCAELVRLRQRHHDLSQRWPSNMRFADNDSDSKRDWLKSQIDICGAEIETMRRKAKK